MRIWQYLGPENPAHHVRLQIPQGKRNTRDCEGHVINLQPESLPHQPSRDKNPDRHRYQKQGSQKRNRRRGLPECGPSVEPIVKGVSSPTKLPSPKIFLPALLVKVGEDQEQHQGDDARHNHHTGSNTVHSVLEIALLTLETSQTPLL